MQINDANYYSLYSLPKNGIHHLPSTFKRLHLADVDFWKFAGRSKPLPRGQWRSWWGTTGKPLPDSALFKDSLSFERFSIHRSAVPVEISFRVKGVGVASLGSPLDKPTAHHYLHHPILIYIPKPARKIRRSPTVPMLDAIRDYRLISIGCGCVLNEWSEKVTLTFAFSMNRKSYKGQRIIK